MTQSLKEFERPAKFQSNSQKLI